jgi:xylulokinase
MATRNSLVAGIDVGTSSVKVLCVDRDGRIVKVRKRHKDVKTQHIAWFETIKECFRELGGMVDLRRVDAVAMASQVNTYILYSSSKAEEDWLVLDWTSGAGTEQLRQIRKAFDQDYFLEHISMPHPQMISYPLPRMKYLKQVHAHDWDRAEKVLQPKDYLYHRMTGVFASDPLTWRGLSNIKDCCFHNGLLKDNGIPKELLPELHSSFACLGRLLGTVSKDLCIRESVPVYLGCNDFFAALAGMGVVGPGGYFDVSGTSEHVGTVSKSLDWDNQSISGPFFDGFVRYGVTTSSGISLEWGCKNFDLPDNRCSVSESAAPIFLPYLSGERSPIWNNNARGVFFGLDSAHDKTALAYSVREGVVFSLYHIWKSLQFDGVYDNEGIRTGGAASADESLNQLKADLFATSFYTLKEKESTALGAAMIGAVGEGWYGNISEAADKLVSIDNEIVPNLKTRERLMRRFETYVSLYPALKDLFDKFSVIRENPDE